jgi:hypothetical protein
VARTVYSALTQGRFRRQLTPSLSRVRNALIILEFVVFARLCTEQSCESSSIRDKQCIEVGIAFPGDN